MLEIRNKRHFILSRNSTVIWISHVSCSFAAVVAFINTVLYFREIDAKYSEIPQLVLNSRVVELNKQKKKKPHPKEPWSLQSRFLIPCPLTFLKVFILCSAGWLLRDSLSSFLEGHSFCWPLAWKCSCLSETSLIFRELCKDRLKAKLSGIFSQCKYCLCFQVR